MRLVAKHFRTTDTDTEEHKKNPHEGMNAENILHSVLIANVQVLEKYLLKIA